MPGIDDMEVDVSVRVRALFSCAAVGLGGLLPERRGEEGDSDGKMAGSGARDVSGATFWRWLSLGWGELEAIVVACYRFAAMTGGGGGNWIVTVSAVQSRHFMFVTVFQVGASDNAECAAWRALKWPFCASAPT
jgi:hypothetical protein